MSRYPLLLIAFLISCISVSPQLSAQTNSQVSAEKARVVPLRVGVVIDESGSARESPLQGVILERALDWVNTEIARGGGDAFLVGFNDQIITSTELVTDVARLRSAAQQLRPIGGSAVRDALVHATQKFNSVRPEPNGTMRVLLFISDGFDNASYSKERRAIESAKQFNVRVYAIGFPSAEAAQGRHLLESIAKQTGAKAFFPSSGQDMVSVMADIDRDLVNGSH